MSKLRKGVIKQQSRKSPAGSKKVAPKQAQAAADAAIRDNFLYRSSIRSYVLAVVFFIVSFMSAGQFWPFNAIRTASGDSTNMGFDFVTGIVSFLFFMFLMFAWGNALEVHGNIIEWKHVIVCILIVTFVAVWGGAASFITYIAGVFVLLTLTWYLNR